MPRRSPDGAGYDSHIAPHSRNGIRPGIHGHSDNQLGSIAPAQAHWCGGIADAGQCKRGGIGVHSIGIEGGAMKLLVALMLAMMFAMAWAGDREIKRLRHVIRDKNIYIDAGCHGRYQGAEYPPLRSTGD